MQSMLKMHHHYHLLCTTPALEFPVCRLRMLDRLEYVRCRTLRLVIVLVLVQWMGMGTVMHMVMATVMAITMAVAMVDLIIMLGMSGSDFFASSVRSLSSRISSFFCNAIHPCTFTSVLWYMIMNDCYRFRTNFFIYTHVAFRHHLYILHYIPLQW